MLSAGQVTLLTGNIGGFRVIIFIGLKVENKEEKFAIYTVI